MTRLGRTSFLVLALGLPAAAAQGATPRQQAAVEAAGQAHQEAVRRADKAVAGIADFIAAFKRNADEKAAFQAIQEGAQSAKDAEVKTATKDYEDSLAALEHVDGGKSGPAAVKHLSARAAKAAEGVRDAECARAREMRRVWRHTQKSEKAKAREVGRNAKIAAREAVKQAWGLERAQRRAGASERAFEGEFDKNEHSAEHLEDRAGDFRDQAEQVVEAFYGRVEEEVERRADEICDAARAHAAASLHAVRRAQGRAHAAAEKAEAERHAHSEMAEAKAAAQSGEKAGDKAGDKADDKASDNASGKVGDQAGDQAGDKTGSKAIDTAGEALLANNAGSATPFGIFAPGLAVRRRRVARLRRVDDDAPRSA